MQINPLTEAQPGDVFLFARSNSIFNLAINIKTWSRFTHCEVAMRDANGWLVMAASRNGLGVSLYDPDLKGLALIMRPVMPFNQAAALEWFATVSGQGYDWAGLLNFTYAKVAKNNNKQFCSEFATRLLRYGGIDLFPEQDADTISPRDFSIVVRGALQVVYRSPAEMDRYQKLIAEGAA